MQQYQTERCNKFCLPVLVFSVLRLVVEMVFFFSSEDRKTQSRFNLGGQTFSVGICLVWLYVRQQKKLKPYTYLLTIPFLAVVLLLDVLAAKDLLPDTLKVKTKSTLIYQIIMCYLCVCCLNCSDFRLNVFFFSPLTLAASVIVSQEQNK